MDPDPTARRGTTLPVLDHLILEVDDLEASLRFYSDVMGFSGEGEDGPFTVVRVDATTVLLLAPYGTAGHHSHVAFAYAAKEFDAALDRIRRSETPFGDSYHDAANMRGPGNEFGAQGYGRTVYLTDPSGHLIELRSY
ncbi:MAG TPA: VOC family protein [Chloroflexota bacterium]|nr:VOC family protein [Chloroflexota bacterium]